MRFFKLGIPHFFVNIQNSNFGMCELFIFLQVWVCMGMHGYAWVYMGCMRMHVYAWVCMGIHGYAWVCMGMHGYAWVCMRMHGYAWLCMHGYVDRLIYIIHIFICDLLFWRLLCNNGCNRAKNPGRNKRKTTAENY
jgi:hypothetical protein